MENINKQIEDTRAELNNLIAIKGKVTDDDEILKVSMKLDMLISQYMQSFFWD